jgi:transcriptional regulator with XRE-family HTH domain
MKKTNRLQKIMGDKNLSVGQLARMSGLSVATISRVERCEEDPKQSTMIAISKALKMKVCDVFNLDWRR